MVGADKKNIGGLAAKRRRRNWIIVASVLVMVLVAVTSVALILKPWTEEFRHGA